MTDYVWTEPYKAAFLETDDGKLPHRIREAKAAIDARLHELQLDHGGTPQERRAISNALTGLNALRTDLEARSQNDIVCRICGKPCPLEDCKADANGKAVHEPCYVRELLAQAAVAEADATP